MNNKYPRLTNLLVTSLVLLALILSQNLIATAAPLPADGSLTTATITPFCSYRTHVQNIGWQNWRSAGATSGTSAQSLRLEAIELTVANQGYALGVNYQTHVQNLGWQNPCVDGQTSGTSGQSLRLEAIRINLTGNDANLFDIYYRVHAQNLGWLDWAQNGNSAGSAGLSYRLEAIEIVIVAKGGPAPGATTRPFVGPYNLVIGQTQTLNYYDVDTLRWVYGSRYQRPIFYDNSTVKITLDSFYDNLEADWVQANNTDYQAFVQSYTTDPAFRANLIGKYENNVTAAVSYDANHIISVTQEQYSYAGGAHGNTTLTAHSFGTKTGDELTLGDIMAIPNNQIAPKLLVEFQNLKNSDPRYADIDLGAINNKLSANSAYYLTNAGVCVYFNPYEVVYGAVGRVELLIPYSRTDLLVDITTLI